MKNQRKSYCKNIVTVVLLFISLFVGIQQSFAKELVDYVNNRIGNISHVLVPTYPTTHLPNSMLRMYPTHREFVTDRMTGFPLNVPSHRGGGILLLKPYSGKLDNFANNIQYSYDREISTPCEYSVLLDDFDISTHFAPAARAAMYTFNYEGEGPHYLILATTAKGEIHINNKGWSGYEYRGIAKHYFYIEFDKTPAESNLLTVGEKPSAYARFDGKNPIIRLRYGISYISEEQAKKNLEKEIKHFDIQLVIQNARSIWNKTLGKIQVEGGTEDQKTTFYTALYRSHERMINISEDGKYYSAFDNKIHDDEGIPYWTDDWIWDTYRALHPLQIILNPTAESQKLTSYLRIYDQSGWIATFPSVSGDSHSMNGNHAAAVFADALCKNIPFDIKKASRAMQHTVQTESMIPWYRGPRTELDDFYWKNGWFPALHPNEKETNPYVHSFEKREAVAVSLAAAYDSWCMSQLAKAASDKKGQQYYENCAYNYRILFNKETGFFHPKDSAGNFIEPFDYIYSGGTGARDYYDENNAWTYIWDVQYNIADLIHLFGSKQAFIDKLDRLFTESWKLDKWEYYAVQPDASGSVGQFIMGNEPSFHIPYLYNYAGQPWKTQKRIRMLMESWFRNDLMGICGDEDGGGMSAFYVFSAMGFYPVTPGMPSYTIGSPLFTKITISLENGKKFIIEAPKSSWENKYIQSVKLNGKPHEKTWFTHDDIINGGVLTLELGERPNKSWGITPDAVPPSAGIRK